MKRLVPALLVTAFLASCSPPLFDYSLSQTVAALKSMTQDNPSPITITSGFDSQGSGFVFYPRVAQSGTDFVFDYSSGFVVSSSNFTVQVRGAAQAPGGYTLYGGASQPLSSPDPHAPPYAAWPLKSSSPTSANLFGVVFNASDPTQNGYAFFMGTPAGQAFSSNGNPMTFVEPVGPVIGASFAAQPSPYDVTSWLVLGAGVYQEMQFQLMPPSMGGGATLRSGTYAFLPAGVTRLQYFYDVNSASDPARIPNRSFASWFDASSGTWKCAAWWGTTGTGDWEMLPIDHRVDALLTTGELLSMENGTGRLYSRDGALVATFPLGSLAFIGEEYVGGTARTYFSQCLQYDNKLEFNVYWILTNQLKTIGG